MGKPLLFRFHRASYAESMATAHTIDGVPGLVKHLRIEIKDFDWIKLASYGLDSRNGWNTQLVMTRREGESVFVPVGYLSDALPSPLPRFIELERSEKSFRDLHQDIINRLLDVAELANSYGMLGSGHSIRDFANHMQIASNKMVGILEEKVEALIKSLHDEVIK